MHFFETQVSNSGRIIIIAAGLPGLDGRGGCVCGCRLCGYIRCRDDDGFGVYIYDLLVDKTSRGKSFGRMLMDRVRSHFPNETVYVMSDVDAYYEKQGYQREGTIWKLV